MVISEYFESIEELIRNSDFIMDRYVDYKEFSRSEGMVRGQLVFLGGYVLEFMEYVCIGKERLKYRFNFSDMKGNLVFRYDNAAHHKDIHSYPHHKHVPEGVEPSVEVGLEEVIEQIEQIISKQV
ncbi:hypothetical protein EFE42_00620 [Methanohalophilus sp. RSK]|uniref:toxin-antitoxin system TumE family protein n=1 Tax=Methanohalophilus sp. RSK TaxID=2485783 RepID=UPI000F43DD29|nr:DUF6516 family protein [Methanohalophilus sp. RSK]RNI15780.1 hypothetical protein EFE42_00620 [Methanohalophilus sp. RSK]